MKKPVTVTNAIIAKCDDGAFRKITLVDPLDGTNATATISGKIVYGVYTNEDTARFVRV